MKRILGPVLLCLMLTFLSTARAEEHEIFAEISTETPELLDFLDARVMWSSPSMDLVQMKQQTENLLISTKTRAFYTRSYNRYSAWFNLE